MFKVADSQIKIVTTSESHSRINDRPAGLNYGANGKMGRLQAALPHNVENSFAAGKKMIGDNTPVATPPYSFRTHYRAA
jgi:hypothetical protein